MRILVKMNNELLKFCLGKGILLDKETLDLLSGFEDTAAREIIDKISILREKVITKSFFSRNAEKIESLIPDRKIVEKLKITFGMTFEITKEQFIEEKQEEKGEFLKIVSSHINLTKKLEVKDFVDYFKVRYNEIKKILQQRKELENLTSIGKLGKQRQNVSIIAMVSEKRLTKNKNILLDVEDITGRLTILINKDKTDLYNIAKEVIIDDIIGIRGTGDNEILFANNIVYPDSFLEEKIKLKEDFRIAFISDIHVGSKSFLEKKFLKFIDWINGEVGDEEQRKEALKVKYLLITGDTIDGVGVFPNQDELLDIKDIRIQYKKLAEYLGKIRKNIKIIMCPGQHDSVRVAEPQHFIGRDYGEALYGLDNLILVSNPAMVEIGESGKRGLKILMYHGASMTAFVNEIESLRLGKAHDHPTKVVKELLKRRHLASMHSAVTYIPDNKEDALLIKEVPDIINTADFHKPEIDIYHNILIVCDSCWQSMTPFEEKVGNHPDPCKVPIYNVKTREIKILDFSDEVEK